MQGLGLVTKMMDAGARSHEGCAGGCVVGDEGPRGRAETPTGRDAGSSLSPRGDCRVRGGRRSALLVVLLVLLVVVICLPGRGKMPSPARPAGLAGSSTSKGSFDPCHLCREGEPGNASGELQTGPSGT